MNIFDTHTYFGRGLFGAAHDTASLDAIAAAHPELCGLLIPAKPYDYSYPSACAVTLAEASRRPGWAAALRVDPWHLEESLDLLRSYEGRSRVLFLHPFEEQIYPTDRRIAALIAEAEQQAMVVMLAAGALPFAHAAQVMPLVRDFPQVTFILTHGAQINICGLHMAEAFELFQRCPNAYFETSGIYRQDFIERAIRELGQDRVLFGSGSPRYDLPFELARMAHLAITEEPRELVLGGNARRLFADIRAESPRSETPRSETPRSETPR